MNGMTELLQDMRGISASRAVKSSAETRFSMRVDKKDVERLLLGGKTIQIKPQGYSMYPLFVPERDEAIIAPLGNRLPKRGDVVLYRRNGGILVLHRIWRRRGEAFYMVGDNQSEIEGPLRKDQIKGILVGIVRKGKKFSVNHFVYRMSAGLWLILRPFRPALSKMVAECKRNIFK